MAETTSHPPTVGWARSLQDSIAALAWAADRVLRALQQAVLLRDGADYHQVADHGGLITATAPGHSRHRHPDDRAIHSVLTAYRTLADTLERDYNDAAWALAYGAHWALREVLAGRTPFRTEVVYDQAGRSPSGHPVLWLEGLIPSASEPIEAARKELDRHLLAGEYAEDIASRASVSEHEASQMFDAARIADGTAAAAHAYGLACQRWLPLTIRYAKQARTAAADTTTEN